MNLEELKRNWEKLGEKDPLWSILTVPTKKGNKWDVREFFKTGEKEIHHLMNLLRTEKIIVKKKKVLDFGCGVGRLSQALAKYFDTVYGVDISASMVHLAEKYNKFPKKCVYKINNQNNLLLFEDHTFDFIYSNIVLQHIPTKYSSRYIKEFLRVLKPKGILVFQLPHKRIKHRYRNYIKRIMRIVLKFRKNFPLIDMYSLKKENVINIINENGGKVMRILPDSSAGEDFVSYVYIVQR